MAAVAEQGMVSLRIELPGSAPEELHLMVNGSMVVGRDASCHVVLPSPDVSRRHLELVVQGQRLYLRDTSSNGTLLGVHGERVKQERVPLLAEVPFQVGPYTLRARLLEGGHRVGSDPGAWNPQAPTHFPPPGTGPVAGRANQPAAPTHARATSGASQSTTPQRDSKGRVRYARGGTDNVSPDLRRSIHRLLLKNLDLARLDRNTMDPVAMRPRVREALTRIGRQLLDTFPEGTDLGNLIEEMADEALGLGPLEALLSDPAVTEIMVVDAKNIFVEQKGRLVLTDLQFTDDEAVRSAIERIVTPLGRRIDESTPLVDARLKDGSRVNAVIPPLALRGPCITIRKFPAKRLRLDNLVAFGSLTDAMARFLTRSVQVRKNVVVSGGTGSGKTTLLNVLSSAIPDEERIVTIEDAAELQLDQPHVVSLEARPPNMEGKGQISIRDLVKNALRMRPDRILVGECRGGEALDMLQAMNTGHDGSMTTTHANSPSEALGRLETLVLMSGVELPARAIREQIAASVHVIVQTARLSDGSRRVTAISEVGGIDDQGQVEHWDIFRFERTGTRSDGTIEGEYRLTGYLPSYVDEFITHCLAKDGQYL